MISAPGRRVWLLTCSLLALVLGGGCSGLGARHQAKKIPQLGVIDPHQSRELQMVSMPPYVVEPPDELEVSVKPTYPDLSVTSLPVQMDGNIDLGFVGDVYVAGLTLEQVEMKVAQQLNTLAGKQVPKGGYQVSVRLVNGSQSKSYYVLGAVTTQGKFPITGNETVLDGILQAGLRTNSLPEKAYLVRPHPAGGTDQIMAIDWFGIRDRGDSLTNYQLFPGDRIIVPGGKPPGLLSTLVGG
ncbi:MAG: polysaccharide biosynthesis/export family protein [Isosphaeraceae bacterium]|nr:polysaccharide biosynthesis/export family protein [Isosphaeraceae bacterium]